jgi:hypothetical protein
MTKAVGIAIRRNSHSEIGWFFYAQIFATLEKPTFGRIGMPGME